MLDAFGNLVTGDNTDVVTLALGNNPGGATLSGGGSVTVSGGVATFGTLSLDKAGTGYTLTASTPPGTPSPTWTATSNSSKPRCTGWAVRSTGRQTPKKPGKPSSPLLNERVANGRSSRSR